MIHKPIIRRPHKGGLAEWSPLHQLCSTAIGGVGELQQDDNLARIFGGLLLLLYCCRLSLSIGLGKSTASVLGKKDLVVNKHIHTHRHHVLHTCSEQRPVGRIRFEDGPSVSMVPASHIVSFSCRHWTYYCCCKG